MGSGHAVPAGAGRGAAEPPADDRVNLGGTALRPAPVGAYPAGASAYGAEQMIGDVWEWTSSDFQPWPGFTPMIYRAYSEPFFGGDYKVLRGGSWAVAPSTIRPSFRNWDHPIRRQIFTGVAGWPGTPECAVTSPGWAPPRSLGDLLLLAPDTGCSCSPTRRAGSATAG